MAKKTLEEKIKDIIFYAAVFFILYLIIGFLIKSEWLSNHDESWIYSYELLRDGLTLTAYFLAPTAAFVLFSDWRSEHIAKNIENTTLELTRLFTDVDFLYYFYNSEFKNNYEVNILNFRHERLKQTLPDIRHEILENLDKIILGDSETRQFREKAMLILYKTNELNSLYCEFKGNRKDQENETYEKIIKKYNELTDLISTTVSLGRLIRESHF